MGQLTCKIVRPDRLMYEGPAASVVLVMADGEMGVYPGHSPFIGALGEGVMRFRQTDEQGGGVTRFVVKGGYAEVRNDEVIVLAGHARAVDDIDEDVVQATRDEACAEMAKLDEDDHRRRYYEEKVEWCDLLLAQAQSAGARGR